MVTTNVLNKAIQIVEKHGFLLVFPIKNSAAPDSLWAQLNPGLDMRWEWDDSADNKLVQLWHLREALAQSHQVIYGKYYQGRATLFSKSVFKDLLTLKKLQLEKPLSPTAQNILENLEMDSPLSTKQIKIAAELQGKFLDSTYHRSMKELWQSLSIVATGEVDDGAFPSLAHSATNLVFEDIWNSSTDADPIDAWLRLCELKNFDLLEKAMF